MLHKINILVLFIFLFYPMSDLKADTSYLLTDNMVMPVDGTILSEFSGTPSGNEGLDIKSEKGMPVLAALDGTVVDVLKDKPSTSVILLRHEQNIYTLYSNIINPTLVRDSFVKASEKIGFVGPGNPPFLHFEVRKGTQPIDPAQFITFKKKPFMTGFLTWLACALDEIPMIDKDQC